MKLLLGLNNETVGEAVEEVSYFLEMEESQLVLRRCARRANGDFKYQGDAYRVMKAQYYGRLDHAMEGYALLSAGHTDTEGAVECLEAMQKLIHGAARTCQALL